MGRFSFFFFFCSSVFLTEAFAQPWLGLYKNLAADELYPSGLKISVLIEEKKLKNSNRIGVDEHFKKNKKFINPGSCCLFKKQWLVSLTEEEDSQRNKNPELQSEKYFIKNKKQLVIASKIFTENILLAEMLALLLEENHGFKVVRKLNMGGTKLVFDALRNRHIDIYPEYTGTGYTMLLKLSGETGPEKTYEIVKREFLKKFNLIWSLPLGFENTYTLAVRKEDPRFQKLKLISQLEGKVSLFRLGANHEFLEREDGFKNFSEKYQLHFRKDNIWGMNQGLMYSALRSEEVDMIMAYSTDGRIKAFNLRTLKDDKKFFPSYLSAYLTRKDVFNKFPELRRVFGDLEGNITEAEMIFLNNQVDQLKYEVSQTARNFLIEKNLLNESVRSLQKLGFLDYYLSKRAYFFKILWEHLLLTFVPLFFALLFALPVGIWAVYNSRVKKLVFTAVNTLQTVPSLALLALLIPFLGIGFMPAVSALFVYSLLPIVRNTFEGIKNVDRDFVEASAGIGLNQWQILRYVQIPLALPVILAGVRISAVIVVGTATLAALIGAGGLGDPVFRGIATLDSRLIFLGAVPACLLAVALDKALTVLERLVISRGLKLKKNIKDIDF